ncbi:hypothetical protein PILCRDRAFT_11971 [Piloderma croceum F 1598]|uniref:Uncharacterized protein n=1 Tax=Piloderma croceum (strain F 1598) TaxID=765440 RepID=A0A0C3FCF3_PILCF|nr:hypothetical protein PILCRDRAFT_11971 [Piloderma croceum F 1598]
MSDDTVKFGINIVGEDNTTIVHHKVSACIHQHQQQHQHSHQHLHLAYAGQSLSSPSSFTGRHAPQTKGAAASFSFAQGGMGGANAGGWRPLMLLHGLGGMGGMGSANVRLPWKSGLTFDHVLSRGAAEE